MLPFGRRMNRNMYCILLFTSMVAVPVHAQSFVRRPRFNVIVLAESGGHHIAFSTAAKTWLNELAADSNVSIRYIDNTHPLNDSTLDQYQLFIQLDYPPYGWTANAVQAFRQYIEKGKGGWLGFHHAGLLGEFDGYLMRQWFSDFMGGIRWIIYPNLYRKPCT